MNIKKFYNTLFTKGLGRSYNFELFYGNSLNSISKTNLPFIRSISFPPTDEEIYIESLTDDNWDCFIQWCKLQQTKQKIYCNLKLFNSKHTITHEFKFTGNVKTIYSTFSTTSVVPHIFSISLKNIKII